MSKISRMFLVIDSVVTTEDLQSKKSIVSFRYFEVRRMIDLTLNSILVD